VPVDRVDVPLLVERLRPDRAPAPGQDVEAEHLGRPLRLAGLQHPERVPDGVGGQRLPRGDELEQLLEQPHGEGVVRRVATDRDLVAADVDVAGQRLFDDPQQLVPGTEQGDHGLRTGNDDLGLSGALAGGCGGHG
jgi:hypothetical protein